MEQLELLNKQKSQIGQCQAGDSNRKVKALERGVDGKAFVF